MPASGYEILKSAKLCAKIANLCAKIAKWVSGVLGVLGVLAVQRLLTRQKDLPGPYTMLSVRVYITIY